VRRGNVALLRISAVIVPSVGVPIADGLGRRLMIFRQAGVDFTALKMLTT
jgi:hypothetical protein